MTTITSCMLPPLTRPGSWSANGVHWAFFGSWGLEKVEGVVLLARRMWSDRSRCPMEGSEAAGNANEEVVTQVWWAEA